MSARAWWVTLEGGNGVGKTHLGRQAVTVLGSSCYPLVELPEAADEPVSAAVIAALSSAGDPFLRVGRPRTETLLLAALQVHRHENARPRPGQTVLEDRGPHTVAAYQSAVLCAPGAADSELLDRAAQILELIAAWRPLPDRVLLLQDEPGRCRHRLEERWRRPITREETSLMERALRVYDLMAAADPCRFHRVDRRQLSPEQVVAEIVTACQ